MAISTATEQWLADLKKAGGLTDEAFNTIRASFEKPEVDEFVKGSALRQSDYSRQMTAVQTAQKAVEDAQRDLQIKQTEVDNYRGTLDGWKAGAEGKFNTAVKNAELASTKAHAALERLKAVAAANGLDEAEVLKDLDTPVVLPNPNQPNMDTSKFLTVDQLNEQVGKAARETAFVDATIMDLATEYRELYGKNPPMGWGRSVVEGALKSKQTLNEYVNREFKFDEKRQEVQKASIAAEIQAGIDAGMAKYTSEQIMGGQNPGGVPQGAVSPVFRNPNIMKPLEADHQSGGGISAAVAASASGKYRPK